MKGKTEGTRSRRVLGRLMIAALAGALTGGIGATTSAAHASPVPHSAQNGCGGKQGCGGKAKGKNSCSAKDKDKDKDKNSCSAKDKDKDKDKNSCSAKKKDKDKNSCSGKNSCKG